MDSVVRVLLSICEVACVRAKNAGVPPVVRSAFVMASQEKNSPLTQLFQNVGEAATLLRMLGNERRLALLCLLVSHKEMSAGELSEAVGLSQSACSQHLAKMREEQLVETRRAGLSVYYRIADPKVHRVVALLKKLYC